MRINSYTLCLLSNQSKHQSLLTQTKSPNTINAKKDTTMSEQQFMQRPLTLEDAQAVADTINAISAHEGTHRHYHADTLVLEWSEPEMDITQSSTAMTTSDGKIVAYMILRDNNVTPVRTWVQWGIHPEYLQHKLNEILFTWLDSRRQNLIERCPADARVVLQCGILSGYDPDEHALNQAGFQKFRNSYQMRIDMGTKPPTPQFPEGISARAYNPDTDLEGLVTAFRNSFSDHFGYVEEPFEKDVEEFRHWFATDKLFDPQYVLLAVDDASGVVAGYAIGMKEEHGDPSVSHIELLGVSRAYRRRGIAQAMLYQCFNTFWDNGYKSVTLGVDGSSLTNAVALYERVGMHIHHQYDRYEKVIREGKELGTVAVDA
jgi:mycothiol synthase